MDDSTPTKRRKISHDVSLNAANEAAASAGLYRPSTFIMETEELLKEVRVDYGKTFSGMEELLHSIKGAIEGITPHAPKPIGPTSKAFEKQHKIRIPYPEPRPDDSSPYKLSLDKPAQFNVVGSYVSKTMVMSQQNHTVDMIVGMPQELFQEKDFLDLRYFYKRAYFLANIASQVKALDASDRPLQLKFEYLNENPLLPVVVAVPKEATVSPKVKSGKDKENTVSVRQSSYRIRLIPCAPDGLFPTKKLLATKGCIRQEKDEDTIPQATPFYNATLRAESTYLAYLRILHQAEKKCSAFRDASVLGRVWLQQRGFDGSVSHGGFGAFEWSVLVALLLQTGGRKGAAALSPSLSSIQIFKAVIQYLATTDIQKKALVLGALATDAEGIQEPGPVIYDAGRNLNIAHKMTSSSANSLRQHAKSTHELFGNSDVDQFTPTFITKADDACQSFDMVVAVLPDVDAVTRTLKTDRRGPTVDLGDTLYQLLKKALGDRVRQINLMTPDTFPWSIQHKSPLTTGPVALTIGIVFDPANMGRQVDHGPRVEEESKKEAKKFRQFWGDKAELRRFKDGGIFETLIWASGSPFDLCREIITYIVGRHLKLDETALSFHGNEFASVSPVKSTDTASFAAARQAFEQLESDIRALELPLQVRKLAPTAPELRRASLKAPAIGNKKSALHPMDVALELEASRAWPDDLAALQRVKINFLILIGSSLEESTDGVSTHLGLENTEKDIANLGYLDVVYSQAASFRIRLQCDVENDLLRKQATNNTLDQHIRQESAALLATAHRLYTILPLHTSIITTNCTRFPALSPTIRLTKSWFASHKLFPSHISDSLIELLVLQTFLIPYPFPTPSSPTTGFLRTLLFLSRWDWRSEPLVVDPAGDFTSADRSALNTRLQAWRKLDPNMNRTVVFAVSSAERSPEGGMISSASEGTSHTTLNGQPTPCRVAATRMTTLARSACKLVREKGLQLDPRALFAPSLGDYDVLIHLDTKVVKSVLHSTDGQDSHSSHFANLNPSRALAPVPQHPVETLLARLREAYGGALMFFHGGEGDSSIGALWNPMVRRRTFRVNLPCSFKPVGAAGGEEEEGDEEEELVEVNREAILAEIARIGGTMIQKIEARGLV